MQDYKNAILQMRFPRKLWYLLNMQTEAILWGGTGRTILLNYRVLHKYLQCDQSIFKTTNISSFVRQLNLYGFRKVTSHLQDPLCNSCNPYMHEYVHDYFQYGRPEMLSKITRKALAIRKSYKPKSFFSNPDQYLYLTPLQKARRTLHEALKKASQDLFIQTCPKQYSINLESEDAQEDFCDNEEDLELDWLFTKNLEKNTDKLSEPASCTDVNNSMQSTEETNFQNITQENDIMLNFKEEQQEVFPSQFLSMPDLAPEPNEDKKDVELLAEFNIDSHDQLEMNEKTNDLFLNCVLPSINIDPNDDVTIPEKSNDNLENYNGEWDQMFSDIINKGHNQECSSDLKELYSQISRTIDLLND